MTVKRPKVGDPCACDWFRNRTGSVTSGLGRATVTAVHLSWLTFRTSDGRDGWARWETRGVYAAWIGKDRPRISETKFGAHGWLRFDIEEAEREAAFQKLRMAYIVLPEWDRLPAWLTKDRIDQVIALLTPPETPVPPKESP